MALFQSRFPSGENFVPQDSVGGGLGGALGNVVGQAVGGNAGAAIGAGVGGAAGGALTAQSGKKTETAIGAGLGAVGGQVIGNSVSGSTGGLIGAGLGGAAGGAVGNNLANDKDHRSDYRPKNMKSFRFRSLAKLIVRGWPIAAYYRRGGNRPDAYDQVPPVGGY
ncbi:YMGG-like glycine zipper-containing protein [Pseudomonas sp. Ant30-3]|uniref:YMGG-like glycine zipper-containing protein n=1 Tax=Pseudomonas sp. Ant30-3 TaxID=1488328 RepID=UPI0009DF9830|nr:glycine zipper domain-containing protein [Pseudomonas sp. Ant30-3]